MIIHIKQALRLMVLLAGLMLTGCGGSDSDSPQPSLSPAVSVSPATETHTAGDRFDRTVEVTYVKGTSYAAFDVVFDPAVIRFQTITEGTFMNQNGAVSTSFQAALEDSEPGKLVVGLTRLGTADEVSGDGILLTLTFQAMNPGYTTIMFGDPKGFRNSSNEEVKIEAWEGGSVTVE